MQISVFGAGYVGLVTGVCFAEKGHDVLCADVDAGKVSRLKDGISPIYEPGLEELLRSNIAAGRLKFTASAAEAVRASSILVIAVGTPSRDDGSADLRHVMDVAESIAEHMNNDKVVVIKSTVSVGTNAKVRALLERRLAALEKSYSFDVISNPEFLREGWALQECLMPARVVVGTTRPESAALMKTLYSGFLDHGRPLHVMDPASAEMTKYAANAMLAARISMMNEFSRLCERTGADIEKVREALGSDPRIGSKFLNAGLGYGGSCFPKDIRALIHVGAEHGEDLEILEAVTAANRRQRDEFVVKVSKVMGSLEGKTIAVWGLSFKPQTDDVREAPSFDVIRKFLGAGAKVRAYDPIATENFRREFGEHPALEYAPSAESALQSADALCLLTEWEVFRAFPRERLNVAAVFDGRNIFDPEQMKRQGISYHSVGRPSV